MTSESAKMPRRSRLASVLSYGGVEPSIADTVFLADGARIIGDVTLEDDVSIWFNAVVRGDVHSIHIGAGTNVQDNAVIHCTFQTAPTRIGKCVTIGHLAMLHGCTVEDECLIGMQAVVLDGAVVGAQSLVGAGAVVTQGTVVPPRSLVLGSPAKVVRSLRDDEIEGLKKSAQNYLRYTEGYSFPS